MGSGQESHADRDSEWRGLGIRFDGHTFGVRMFLLRASPTHRQQDYEVLVGRAGIVYTSDRRLGGPEVVSERSNSKTLFRPSPMNLELVGSIWPHRGRVPFIPGQTHRS